MREITVQFLRFSMIGSLGFVLDAGALQLLVFNRDLNPYEGRIISYLVAASVTWMLNRKFTFSARTDIKAHHQWLRYLLANGVGALLNYFVYSLFIFFNTFVYHHLYFGVLAGSIVGLFFNFNLSRRWVFKSA